MLTKNIKTYASSATFLLAFMLPLQSYAIDLKQAVKHALNSNPSQRVELSNVSAVANELEESSNAFGPTVDLFGDVGVQRRLSPTSSAVSGGIGGSTQTNASREIGIRTSLVLFDGLERANQVYRNAARLDGATFRLLAASETLALNAVEAYVDVVRHRNLMGATRQNISRHKKFLKQIKQRVAGGKSPFSDQIQIEERVFAAESVLLDVKNSLDNAEDKFKKVIGLKPKGKMRIPRVANLPKSKTKHKQMSVANNYTIKQAQKAINELRYSKEVVSAGTKPRLSLDGRASIGEDRNGTRGDETDLYLGLTLSWRLYDGGVIQSREAAAVSRISQAEAQNDVAIREVQELAGRSWNAYSNGLARAGVLHKQIKTNKRIVSSYQEEYELAKRSLLDVLDAERALFNNRFQHISVVSSYQFAAYRILATMSRLSTHFNIDAHSQAPAPVVEERIVSDPKGIFNVTIEPLR